MQEQKINGYFKVPPEETADIDRRFTMCGQKDCKSCYPKKYSREEETINTMFPELLKWVDVSTLDDVARSSVFDGGFKNNNQAIEHLKNLIEMDEKMVYNSLILNQENKKINNSEQKSGEKHNRGKLPMSKLFTQFPDALQAVVLASCYGHNKYKDSDLDWLNFKKVPGGSQAYKDACLRHSLGAEKDEESGLPEVFHQAWNKLAELQLWLEENNINIKNFSKEYLDNLK